MSPLQIGLCLHYHSSGEDDPRLRLWSPITADTSTADAVQELVAAGLLIDRFMPHEFHEFPRQRFGPTPKLHAYVAMLIATPMPEEEHRWFDPRTKAWLGVAKEICFPDPRAKALEEKPRLDSPSVTNPTRGPENLRTPRG